MNNRKIPAVLLAAAFLLLTGCQDYKGLDELTVVAGMAIDEDADNPGGYRVTFEIVDMTSGSKGEEMQSKLLETRGNTITEAVYNANRKLHTDMYFGNAETLILSHQLAEERGLDPIVDPFLRDGEIRDNLYILISAEETARELIEPSGKIVSFYLNKNIMAQKISANALESLELYEIYDIIAENTTDLTLPLLRFSDRQEKEISFDGMALFYEQKMVGSLESTQTPFYMLAAAKLTRGSFEMTRTAEDSGELQHVTMVNRESTPRYRYRFDGERFTFTVEINMVTSAVEFSENWKTDGPGLREIEQEMSALLSREIKEVIERLHRQYGVEVIGFAERIRNLDPRLWSRVEKDWQQHLKDAEVIVEVQMIINDTGLIKQY